MRYQNAADGEAFFSTPFAELEGHGLSILVIQLLEKHFGLYVGDLRGVGPEELTRVPGLAADRLKQVQEALRSLHREVVGEHPRVREAEAVDRSIAGGQGEGGWSTRASTLRLATAVSVQRSR